MKQAKDLTEEQLLTIYHRAKQFPKGFSRITLIDKDYVPAGAKDLNDPHHKAFSELITSFLKDHENIEIDDIPDDFMLRSCLLGLRSQSTSLRGKSLDYLMQLKQRGKYTPPPPKEERDEDDPEDERREDLEELKRDLGL